MKARQFRRRDQAGLANRSTGFSLIELMVGMGVGLLVTLAIAGVLLNAENQRRTSTTGSDAQINGGLAIYTLERQLTMAGYGITTNAPALGCALGVQYAGDVLTGPPPVLAPVLITAGLNGAPDSVRILASSKPSFVMPSALTQDYDPNDPGSVKSKQFTVTTTLGIKKDDLMVLVYGPDQPCQLFQAGDPPGTNPNTVIARADSATWNGNGFPSRATDLSTLLITDPKPYVLNLGALRDHTYTVSSGKKLSVSNYSLLGRNTSTEDVQSNIIMLKAFYGKDTNGDNVLDTFDAVMPLNNAEWKAVRAVRVAVLARSAQYEKDEVTAANPEWNVGTAAPVTGSAACGSGRCVTLRADLDGGSDWKHYRYKIFDVLVPLRNQVWRSDLEPVAAPSAPASGRI